MTLDEIKYDENADFEHCFNIYGNVFTKPINKMMELIKKDINIKHIINPHLFQHVIISIIKTINLSVLDF